MNLILDLIFVVGFRWGIYGAAAATAFSQAVMKVFLVAYAARKYSILRFLRGKNRINTEAFSLGLRFGIPPMIQSLVKALGNLLLQSFMNGFGSQTVTAITTAYRVDTILLLPIINLTSGISTLTAQGQGAGDQKCMRRTLTTGVALMTGISIFLTGFIIVFGGNLIAMFGVSVEATAIGRTFFRQIAGFYIIYGIAMAVRGYLEGLGDVVYSSAVVMFSLGTRIAASYLLKPFFDVGAIAYAEVVS